MSSNSNENTKVTKIECTKKDKFTSASKVQFYTKTDIAEMVNQLFRPAFKDYNGSFVQVIQPPKGIGPVYVQIVLDFIPGSDNREGSTIAAYRNIGEVINENGTRDKNSITSQIMAYNAKAKSRQAFEITQEAVEMLTPFLSYFTQGLKPNVRAWMASPYTVEKEVPVSRNVFMGETKFVIHEGITCLDLGKIFEEIYGTKNEAGHRVKYEIQPSMAYHNINPVNNAAYAANIQPPATQTNYLFMATQIDEFEVKEACKRVGFIGSTEVSMPDYPVVTD